MVSKFANSTDGLIYVSETDALFEYVSFPKIGELSAANVARAAGIDTSAPATVSDHESFFRRLVENKDWFGPKEKEQTKRFKKLKELLEKELTDIKVFRFGKIRIDILIVGKNVEGKVEGLRTYSVET
mgnify:CR=1 FL=1